MAKFRKQKRQTWGNGSEAGATARCRCRAMVRKQEQQQGAGAGQGVAEPSGQSIARLQKLIWGGDPPAMPRREGRRKDWTMGRQLLCRVPGQTIK